MSNVAPARGRPFVLVVAVDLADTVSGGYALEQAMRIGMRIEGSQLHVVYVTTSDVSEETLGLLRLYVAEKIAAFGPLHQGVGVHVRKGDSSREIAQLAVDLAADMIVVGTHKATLLKSLFVGSTAERVLAIAKCPVVVAGPKPAPRPSHVIVIEGPCPDCVQARLDTRGGEWWCARHSEHHAVLRHHRQHLYSYHPEIPFETHDSEVTATGIDSSSR